MQELDLAPEAEQALYSEDTVEYQQDDAAAQSEESQPQESHEQVEDQQEKNWRAMRQSLDEQKRYNQALQQQLADFERKLSQPQQAQPEPEEEDLAEDDYPTYGRVKKATSRLKNEMSSTVSELKKELAELKRSQMENQIRSRYPDFDAVVTPEAIQDLKESDPEIAASLSYLSSDPYLQATTAYKYLKKINTGQAYEEKMVKDRVNKNLQKPKPTVPAMRSQALGEAQRFANGLTPDLQKALWKEMNEAVKQ